MFTSASYQQDGAPLYHNVDDVQSEKIFLFIGNESFHTKTFRHYFDKSFQVASFRSAKKILSGTKEVPEMIILDMPLSHLELIEFKVWLRARHLQNIPIIYNESALNKNEIRRLFNQKIIDDVVSIDNHYLHLEEKSRFLKKINNDSVNKDKLKKSIEPASCHFCFLKRFFDFVFALIFIMLFIPLILLIAICIKIESRGPVFYLSNRAGRGFKIFKFYKFRTMILDADKKIKEYDELNLYENNNSRPAFFKLQNDPRVTRVGAILRKISLDELPQLFNVLKGDMSIVGNRPLPLYEASTLTTDEWAVRFMAPAGITGLWQVSKQGKENMTNEERILLDINYAKTRSLYGDFKIILQTPAALIQKTNV
jgi:lipopolysaccharide/colanic/teichoic acid biosynthesis glycosyltransferase